MSMLCLVGGEGSLSSDSESLSHRSTLAEQELISSLSWLISSALGWAASGYCWPPGSPSTPGSAPAQRSPLPAWAWGYWPTMPSFGGCCAGSTPGLHVLLPPTNGLPGSRSAWTGWQWPSWCSAPGGSKAPCSFSSCSISSSPLCCCPTTGAFSMSPWRPSWWVGWPFGIPGYVFPTSMCSSQPVMTTPSILPASRSFSPRPAIPWPTCR